MSENRDSDSTGIMLAGIFLIAAVITITAILILKSIFSTAIDISVYKYCIINNNHSYYTNSIAYNDDNSISFKNAADDECYTLYEYEIKERER